MKRNFVFTIVYFRDFKFFMISANCFRHRSHAVQCASEFCKSQRKDGHLWDFEIEKSQVRS